MQSGCTTRSLACPGQWQGRRAPCHPAHASSPELPLLPSTVHFSQHSHPLVSRPHPLSRHHTPVCAQPSCSRMLSSHSRGELPSAPDTTWRKTTQHTAHRRSATAIAASPLCTEQLPRSGGRGRAPHTTRGTPSRRPLQPGMPSQTQGRQRQQGQGQVQAQGQGGEGAGERGAAEVEDKDWVSSNSAALRALPLVCGAIGGSLILINRLLADIPAVADAGSSQARADVLSLFMAASLTLTGLQWVSLTPRVNNPVALEGLPCLRIPPSLPESVRQELQWAWETLSSRTCCRSLLLLYRGQCVLQAGLMAPSAPAPPQQGGGGAASAIEPDFASLWGCSISTQTRKFGRANYLAKLALFPARFELLEVLPYNTQAAILLPLGEDDGLLVVGGDTIRGFSPLDQAWIASLGEKLDSTLSEALSPAPSAAA